MTRVRNSSIASLALTLLTVAGVVATTRAVTVGLEQRISAAEDTVTIGGRVVDPDRKPVAEASVGTYSIGDDGIHLKKRASSDAQGKFKLSIAKSELDGGPFKIVVAKHKDFGMAITELADLSKTEDVLLRLVKNTPIQGRIIDSEGKPVADAQMNIEFATAIRDENFAAYVAALRNEKRAAENDSFGTDHGTAGPVFVAGRRVHSGIFGETPRLTELDDGNLKWSIDYRRVYATLLEKWLGIPSANAVGAGLEMMQLFPA